MRTPAFPPLTIEHSLLGFVYEAPLHGYEIYRQLSAPTGLWQVWRLKQSQLYALLAKLEEARYLSATLQAQDGRPPRKIYALNESGRTAFDNWLRTSVAHVRQIRIEFRAKLYFAHRQDPSLVHLLLERQSETCQLWLEDLQAQTVAIPESDYFAYAVQQYRLNQVQSVLGWLATCREGLVTPVQHE